MTQLKRYYIGIRGILFNAATVTTDVPDVEYVEYSDYESLQAERDRLREALKGFMREFGDKATNANVIRARRALEETKS